ncbi:AraC family transcriptional regulator [Variovorax sp. ZS18.2.2]|uniref:AraC family transcriptional regulator n=1 Tax=Variovorax sp. ZS18.2.2 TaxID=2971255 RepID=UPI00215115FC|nr:AraC family transcriptional regulator [Variovorax sp. ZS18.2.2]MCR6476917.1 AraC family transcriptional regulator [Variovorax sp. ZS18.2.2]
MTTLRGPSPRLPDPVPAGTQRLPMLLQTFDPLAGPETAPPLGFIDLDASVSSLAHGVAWQAGRCHYHHGYELHLLAAPHRCAYVGGEIHRLAAGSLVLIGPRLPHNLAYVGLPGDDDNGGNKARSFTLRFADEPFRKGMALFPELREAEAMLDRAHQGIEFFGLDEAVVERFHRVRNLRGLQRFAEFAALLHELSRWQACRRLTTQHRRHADSASLNERTQQIYRVLDFINANYMQELSLSRVSEVAGIPTISAFSRYFRQVTGSTFTECVISLRVAKACQLLLNTRKHVGSICYEVGFNNISNFNRHFRAIRGMPPGEYRASGGAGAAASNGLHRSQREPQ